MILTTIDCVPGAEMIATLGMVVACVPYWGSKYAEGISNLHGTTNQDVPAAFEARRTELLDRLARHAAALRADAVVGVRMDTREITGSWKELCAYGTAVRLAG